MLNNDNVPGGLKALSVTLLRLAIEEPRVLLVLDHLAKKDGRDAPWKLLYDDFEDLGFRDSIKNFLAHDVSSFDWSVLEQSYINWGRFGWITDHQLLKIGSWDHCPDSQVEADKKILKEIDKKFLAEIQAQSIEKTRNIPVFEECCKCFENKCYTACASLLISLIDGELIRGNANSVSNRKTGATAGRRIISDVSTDDMYGLPGLLHLELINYEAFINMLFEHANGFEIEPKRMNRNFMHHGMSKRKVLRKDCIKLFMGYHKTLFFMWDKSPAR